MLRELRQATRGLIARPWLTPVIVVTLALGVGANAAVFSIVFVDVAAYTDQGQYNASGDGPPEELAATITTHNIFDVLGVEPAMSRTWPEHYDRSRHFSVVISDSLWQRRFARDPNVRARTMTLDGAEGSIP
jgi:hypothetical protein